MVPAILILTFAWSLKAMTDSLGAKYFVRDFVYNNAGEPADVPARHRVRHRLPAGLCHRHQLGHLRHPDPHRPERLPHGHPLAIICISACMAGAVCGDHCSPISDTTKAL